MSEIATEIATADWCPTCVVVITIDWYLDDKAGWGATIRALPPLVPRDEYRDEA
jgi:hypothetical protein